MRKSHSPTIDTCELILNAAGRIFAENGFHATTVRQITKEAGVNLAAVNYHFHDKQELYVSVLKRAYQAAAKTAEADRADTPQEQLRIFIRNFLAHLLDPKRPEWQGVLIAREMAQPTKALDRLATESIQPVKQRLVGIVTELLGPGVPETRVNLSSASIIGQCLHYVHCREMISRLFPKAASLPRDIETLTEHIYEFSMGGLTAIKGHSKTAAKHRRLKPHLSL
jgi:AcrR family transcriptional regulator